MAYDHLHICRLGDDAERGFDRRLRDPVDKAPHAGAAQLLAIGNGDMDGHLEVAAAQLRY
jgi:hypothetical protein